MLLEIVVDEVILNFLSIFLNFEYVIYKWVLVPYM